MSGRILFRATLSAVLIVLAAGFGLVRRSQGTGPGEPVEVSASAGVGAPWVTAELDTGGDTGRYVSVAIDPDYGGIYVSYYNLYENLCIAHYVGSQGNCGPEGTWYCQTVAWLLDVGRYSSIAAADEVVGISYYAATDGELRWARSLDRPLYQTWEISTVDRTVSPSKTGLYTSLCLPERDQPVISYQLSDPGGPDALRIATYVGSSGSGNCGYGWDAGDWKCETIVTGEGMGRYTSLAMDHDEHKHIAFYDGANGDLWYATSRIGSNCGPGGNTWTCYPVSGASADVGQYASMYVDSGHHFHIAYYDATQEALKYAVDVGGGGNCGLLGSAQCDEIDTMQAGYHPLGISIAEDPAGYPVIAYQSANGSLKLARPLAALGLPPGAGNCGPEAGLFRTWSCETIDRAGTWVPYRNGDFASVAVSPAGLVAIAYNGFITPSGGNLDVAYQRFRVFLPWVAQNQ